MAIDPYSEKHVADPNRTRPARPPYIALDKIDALTLARSILAMTKSELGELLQARAYQSWAYHAVRILAEEIDRELAVEVPASKPPSEFDAKMIEQARRLSCAKIATRMNPEGFTAEALIKDAQDVYNWITMDEEARQREVAADAREGYVLVPIGQAKTGGNLGRTFASAIPDDEPVFLLRGQDESAPRAIQLWIEDARTRGASEDILRKADEQIGLMIAWQISHHGKVADL